MMLKKLRYNSRAQAFSEYAATVAVIMAVMIVMTTFLKRVLQGRIKGAQERLYTLVDEEHNSFVNAAGEVYVQYEPYYAETNQEMTYYSDLNQDLYPAGITGISNTIVNQMTNVTVQSRELPVTEAN